MKSLLLAPLLLLAACATAPAVIEKPVEVKVPVAIKCLQFAPDKPAFLDDVDLLTGSGAQVFDRVWADHLARRDYEGELEAALGACIKP